MTFRTYRIELRSLAVKRWRANLARARKDFTMKQFYCLASVRTIAGGNFVQLSFEARDCDPFDSHADGYNKTDRLAG
jgi:hypothetical protein